jgi:hypothetical protein
MGAAGTAKYFRFDEIRGKDEYFVVFSVNIWEPSQSPARDYAAPQCGMIRWQPSATNTTLPSSVLPHPIQNSIPGIQQFLRWDIHESLRMHSFAMLKDPKWLLLFSPGSAARMHPLLG